jgi:ATP-dependent Lon protease
LFWSFLLARYCASDDPAEIQAGLDAVLDTLSDNYVRPNEANAAQSKVATKGQYRFIDKVHVNYVEKDRRHWAALENFDSRKVAISEKYYKDNDRLLQGGLWAEVTICIQRHRRRRLCLLHRRSSSRFSSADSTMTGIVKDGMLSTVNSWMDTILRSVGLEPSKLSHRVKMHFITRLIPLVEPNYNFIELGPRGTGKSYFFQ